MHETNIKNIDLNLLKVLIAVAEAGSVTGAAAALGIGQPAVSQALSRLRLTLKDELFVRGPGGMRPTARLRQIIGPIRAAIGQIDRGLFGDPDFDAETTDTRFILGVTDYSAAMMGPGIMAALGTRMPRASLSLVRADKQDAAAMLIDGSIDAAIGMFSEKNAWLRKRRLYDDQHVAVFNPTLLSVGERLTIEAYVGADHILVSFDGSPTGFVDRILEGRGYRRRIALTTPYFLQCGYLLERLPCIATLPRRFVDCCSTFSSLAVRDLPFDAPRFEISTLWRASDDKDPRSIALQQVLQEAVAGIAP